jgi:hypothetical protein
MKRSLENSIELSKNLSNNMPELNVSFDQIRKDEKLYGKAKEMERHLIEAHDLFWDLKLALIGIPSKATQQATEKKRRGRPPKKKTS